jgi:hypothetical protein
MADLVRWTFYDIVDDVTYVFEINPSDGGTPAYKKHVTYTNTTAPNGKTLMFEGSREAQVLEWTGTILEQTHLEALAAWWSRSHQLRLTDDLGRTFYIVITDFEPKRIRNAQRPWKHTYTMRATVVNWP